MLALVIGQSNVLGGYPCKPALMPLNNGVKSWQSPKDSPTDFQWMVADPQRDGQIKLAYRDTQTGMKGRFNSQGDTPESISRDGYPFGNVGWSFCNEIQKHTGEDVQMLLNGRAGTSIVEWLPGGVVERELAREIITSMAGQSPNVVIWMQGETDLINGMHADEYASLWRNVREYYESLWGHTVPWLVCELGESYRKNYGEWTAQHQIANDSGVTLVSSKGLAEIAWYGDHFTGEALHVFGTRLANAYLGKSNRVCPVTVAVDAAKTLTTKIMGKAA